MTVETIDSLWPGLVRSEDVVALKVDTQGFESEILRGAQENFASVSVFEVELALFELYEGQRLVYEMLPEIRDLGFRLCLIDSGFIDENPETLDADFLWVRDDL